MRKSELPKWGLNELCCKRTVHRWNRLELNFPSMYGTGVSHSTQKLSLEGALHGTVVHHSSTVFELQLYLYATMRDDRRELTCHCDTGLRLFTENRPAAAASVWLKWTFKLRMGRGTRTCTRYIGTVCTVRIGAVCSNVQYESRRYRIR